MMGHHGLRAARLRILLGIACAAALAGCDDEENPPASVRTPSLGHDAPAPEEVVYSPAAAPDGSESPRQGRVVPAFRADRAFSDGEPVRARRLVYRVSLRVPPVLGHPPATVARPGAELTVDVSPDRLRAVFSGLGWPIPPGSEVRVRRDEAGAYVFDDDGGRPLGPGQLASWFQGGRVRRAPMVRVRSPAPEEQSGPGPLLCRLLAEWSAQPPDALERRCGEGGSVPMFRVGPWLAERTADVPVDVPRAALRADHIQPPDPIAATDHAVFLGPKALERLEPRYRKPVRPEGDGGPRAGLRVANEGRTRVLVVAGGVALGWVDPGATAQFEGFEPGGVYRIGAMRPLGLPALTSRSVTLPGEIRILR